MPLTGAQSRELEEALASAFFSRNQMAMMVHHQLDVRLNEIVGDQLPLKDLAALLVQYFEASGDLPRLVDGAVAEKPNSQELRAFYDKVWLPLSAPGTKREELKRQLQTMIRPGEELEDVDVWIRSLMENGSRVCCIEITAALGTKKGILNGTGFLVGRDLVVSNYHVMEPVILGEQGKETASGSAIGAGYAAKTEHVRLRFDYKLLPDGSSLGTESVHQLDGTGIADWLVDHSPYSSVDLLVDPAGKLPTTDELDYAVVRLKRPAADDTIASRNSAPRGYVKIPASPSQPGLNEPLLIVQHPEGKPMKLAFHTITDINGNKSRVNYAVNTKHGSSGSPCFNYRWDLVALHHSGDPHYKPVRNQGIPFAAIRERLTRQGVSV